MWRRRVCRPWLTAGQTPGCTERRSRRRRRQRQEWHRDPKVDQRPCLRPSPKADRRKRHPPTGARQRHRPAFAAVRQSLMVQGRQRPEPACQTAVPPEWARRRVMGPSGRHQMAWAQPEQSQSRTPSVRPPAPQQRHSATPPQRQEPPAWQGSHRRQTPLDRASGARQTGWSVAPAAAPRCRAPCCHPQRDRPSLRRYPQQASGHPLPEGSLRPAVRLPAAPQRAAARPSVAAAPLSPSHPLPPAAPREARSLACSAPYRRQRLPWPSSRSPLAERCSPY